MRRRALLASIVLASACGSPAARPVAVPPASADAAKAGYGFTAEPDFLYAIRTSDGSVAGKTPIASAAHRIMLDGDRIDVVAYDMKYSFTLSE